MAVLLGTSKTRFVDFEDTSSGIGGFLGKAFTAMQTYLQQVDAMIAEDTFVEDGVQDVAGFSNFDAGFSNIKEPTRRKTYTQTPKGTVFIKKRMFSTLRNNFDPRFMSTEDKVFIRAAKHLFKRKCDEIAFYENLIKLENINDNPGFLRLDGMFGDLLDAFFHILNVGYGIVGIENTAAFFSDLFQDQKITDAFFSNTQAGVDARTNAFSTTGSAVGTALEAVGVSDGFVSGLMELLKRLYKLKEVNERSKGSNFTRWVYDSKTADVFGLGAGVGVIELCLVSDIRTSTGVTPSDGSCSLLIEDPYKLTMITEADIEVALRQALAEENGLSGVLDITANFQLEQAQELDRQLNEMRRARGVSEINFEFVFGSGNAIGKIIETNFEFDETTAITIPEPHSLTAPELVRTIEIINKLSSYLTLQQRAAAAFQNLNKDFNGIRQRMRNEFSGHSIIQPMDAVHVFVNSNTKDESIVYENRPDVALGNILQNFTEKYDTMSQELIEQEAAQLAPGIPVEIYRLIRDSSMWRSDGISVFAGVVQNIKQSYQASNGKFNLSVSATNNLEYLKMTRLNATPSLAQPTKFLDDPLTPFDVDVNSSSGLVTGTPKLSQENNKRLSYLRFDDGFYLGTTVEDPLRLFQDIEGKGPNSRVFFQHVPGLLYKWKSGIVTETLNVNVDRPLNGEGSSLNDALSTVPQTIYSSPFANLDAADVISILVTGQPYNYGNFLRNAMDMNTFSVDNSNNSKHYFNYLFDIFERNKPVTGNFIPAKDGVVNPRDAILAFSIKKNLSNENSTLAKLQRELAEAQDSAKKLAQSDISDPGNDRLIATLNDKIIKLQSQLSGKRSDLQSMGKSVFGGVSVNTVGNDVLVNVPDMDLADVNRKIKYTIKRKPEEVRYNKDKNFFIVSNQYDQDTDIQAFAVSLRDKSGVLMNSDYKTPYDLAIMTANSLNFELFCDTNGNIVFRPPEYNKTPLSLLMKMIALAKGDGTSLAPKFVIDMFETRANTTEEKLLQTELEIYERLLLLGLTPTQADIKLLLKDPLKDGNLDEREAAAIQGITNTLMIPFFLNEADAVKESLAPIKDVFTPAGRISLLQSNSAQLSVFSTVVDTIMRIRNQLNSISGRTDKVLEDTIENRLAVVQDLEKYSSESMNGATSRVNAFQQLGTKISQRQLLLQTYGKLIKNQFYFADADSAIKPKTLYDHAVTSWNTAISGNPDVPQLPQVLKDLIENDLSNDDGPRSGKRFIVNDDVILSMDFEIQIPEFNRVTVTGNSDGNANNLVGAPSAIPNLYTASAVDFDSWRQYGLRERTQPYHRVDFVNAETQGAPFAVFKLIEQRKRIHAGQIIVIGNEYYQPGDVIYVNDKSMLYYVTKVDHSLNFSNNVFTTTLTLEYGRSLGEYIPTPLDIIGKGMISAQRRAYGNIGTKRFPKPSSSIFVLDTLIAPNYLGFDGDVTSPLSTNYRVQFFNENRDRIKNIIIRAASKINDKNKDQYKIELRGYYIAPANTAEAQALNTKAKSATLLNFAFDAFSQVSMLPEVANKIDPSKIIMVPPIDITANKDISDDDKRLRRFPSANAWGMSNALIDIDGVGLPLNVVDVVFVVDKSRRGDVVNKFIGDFPTNNSNSSIA
jgi:hypothetical protein